MHKKNFALRTFVAGILTIVVTPIFAAAAPPATPAAATTVEPSVSVAPSAQLASVIAPVISSRLGYGLKPMLGPARATDPLASSAFSDASGVESKIAASPVAAPEAVKSSAPSAAELKLLAELDAELNATESKLDKANAQLTSGQKQLVRVASLLQSEMLQGGPDSRGLHPFVRVAQRYAGTPYVWGGESARGFDCSGFIIRVMRDLGYEALPHSAAEQFRYGIPVAKPNLRPGDLVFFANTYKPGISHVGIYLGRGRFIHAAGTALGTIVSSLNSGNYAAKYAGARRLVRVKS